MRNMTPLHAKNIFNQDQEQAEFRDLVSQSNCEETTSLVRRLYRELESAPGRSERIAILGAINSIRGLMLDIDKAKLEGGEQS